VRRSGLPGGRALPVHGGNQDDRPTILCVRLPCGRDGARPSTIPSAGMDRRNTDPTVQGSQLGALVGRPQPITLHSQVPACPAKPTEVLCDA